MAGGLMTLAAIGAQNIILNGNPKKTFFKASYKKYTNFAMQKFRLDYNGQKVLRLNEDSFLEFKVPRYADLFHDTYVVVTLPDIYSPIYFPSFNTEPPVFPNYDASGLFLGCPYEFRWIEHLGTSMIRQITITGGGQILAQYTGEYLDMLKERDFTKNKKELWHKMTGHTCELNDPGNCFGNINAYPSVMINPADVKVPPPSIRGRKLYIPLEAWFGISSKLALPLVAIQYNEIVIKINFRPIRDLYKIRDIQDISNSYPYIAPLTTNEFHNFYRFLHPPIDNSGNYPNKRTDWNADIHLISTYIFLDKEEQSYFAENEHHYLVQQVFEHVYYNIAGSTSIELNSRDLVSDYMWRFRRSDAPLRNEWSNYTNWAYNNILPIQPDDQMPPSPFPGIFVYTDNAINNVNTKLIQKDLSIVFDGEYRENMWPQGIYNYIEKWIRTTGNAKDGIYCYNFCIDSNPREYQPSGATNMSMWAIIRFDFQTIEPPFNPVGKSFENICENGDVIGVRKQAFDLHDYTFELRVWESRFNIINIVGGRIGLMYAR